MAIYKPTTTNKQTKNQQPHNGQKSRIKQKSAGIFVTNSNQKSKITKHLIQNVKTVPKYTIKMKTQTQKYIAKIYTESPKEIYSEDNWIFKYKRKITPYKLLFFLQLLRFRFENSTYKRFNKAGN